MMATLTITTAHTFIILTVSHGLLSANPVLHDGNSAAASVHSYRTSLKYRRLTARGMKKRSPVHVISPSQAALVRGTTRSVSKPCHARI